MKWLTICLLSVTLHFATYSQAVDTAGYIPGTMYSADDSLAGYFRFDHRFDQNGETVSYRKDLQTSKTKRFRSKKYDYFTSEGLYMELFAVMPYGFSQVRVMVPRVINGPIQLFYFPHAFENNNIFRSKKEPEVIKTYMIKTANWKGRINYGRFKREMHEILGDSSLIYKQIVQETLQYEDIPMIVQLANMNADDAIIQDYIARKKSAGLNNSQ